MLVLLSVGISNYLSKEHPNLPLTTSDSRDIYRVLSLLGGENFSHERSSSQVNISSNQFLSLLESVCSSLNDNDILVLYFSGHGSLNYNELFFCFEDSNCNSSFRGKVSFSSVKQILFGVMNSVICIFDCCNSATAIKSSLSTEIFKQSNLSILASSRAYDSTLSSKGGEKNSPFTSRLITHVESIYSESGKVTIVDLVNRFKGSDYEGCMFHAQEGLGDVAILESTGSYIERSEFNFEEQFFLKVKASDIRTREMLWYSLKDIPNNILIKIFKLWLENDFFEPSWLVRRAVGSILANKAQYDKRIFHIVERLLSSRHWSDHCIGIIGARFLLTADQNIKEKVEELCFGPNRMDVVWLAHLYLSDNGLVDIDKSLSTELSSSLWGLIDILDRHKNNISTTIFHKVIKRSEEIDCSDSIKAHIKLTHPDNNYCSEIGFSDVYDVDFVNFLKFMYERPKRDKTIDQNLKWLLSVLFGEWRGQLDLSLGRYFSALSVRDLRHILNKFNHSPSVECRMALFQYLSRNHEHESYLNYISWLGDEQHPWVRREAFETIAKYKGVDNADASLTHNSYQVYPGYTDLILSYMNFGIIDDVSIFSEELTQAELNALKNLKI